MKIISAVIFGLTLSASAFAQNVYIDGGNVQVPGVVIQGGNVQVPGVSIQGGNVQVQGAVARANGRAHSQGAYHANGRAREVANENSALNVDGNQYGNPYAKEQLERLRQINGGGNGAVVTPNGVLTPNSVQVPGVNVRY